MAQFLEMQTLVDGIRQVRLTATGFTGESGKVRVDTLEGFAGFVRGAKSLEVTGTWAVDVGGPEADIITWTADGSEHTVQFPLGNGKSIISTGEFTQCGMSRSTNAATEMTATFTGTFNKPR